MNFLKFSLFFVELQNHYATTVRTHYYVVLLLLFSIIENDI